MVIGRVLDQHTTGIPSVHVRNTTIGKITVSSENGDFRIPAQLGDTLLLSSVGFQSLQVIVKANWLDEMINLVLYEANIKLEGLTISSIPSIEQFKEQVMNYRLKDTADFWYFGVAKPIPRSDKMVETNKYKNPLFAIIQPTDFLHYKFSKKAKEQRKYHKMTKSQPIKDRAYKKYTRDWVKTETGLEGDELTSFIAFCNYDVYYLERTSLFIILEDMLVKLEKFQEKGKG